MLITAAHTECNVKTSVVAVLSSKARQDCLSLCLQAL